MKETKFNWIKKLNFKKLNGLIPVITQDYSTNRILMLGFMNKNTLELTVKTGKMHYWSRTRKEVWKKGETSGHTQTLVEIIPDCDDDSLLCRVVQKGPCCHTGKSSCFDQNPLFKMNIEKMD